MKVVRFYSEGELSSIQMTNEDETLSGVKNLFFDEQLVEEQIMLEVFSQNHGNVSDVDELRLDFDRIYTRRELIKKGLFSGRKFVDSSNHNEDFSISTIISIKNEQRYLNASFRSFMVLLPRTKFFNSHKEPLLFATLKNDNFYLVNFDQVPKKTRTKKISNWIKNKIFFKTSSK